MNLARTMGVAAGFLANSGLWACDFGAASGIDLLAVRSLFSLFGLHLAEFATREIIAIITIHRSRR
jgi:hypothetical protein